MDRIRTVALASFVLAALAACGSLDNARGSDSLFAIFAGPSTGDAVEMALDEYDADNRYRGVTMISAAQFGAADSAIALYRDSLDDPDDAVRQASVRALGLHGDPEDIPALLGLFDSENRLVRAEVATALQRLHNPAAIPALIERTDPEIETDPQVRAQSARALGQYPERRVLQALISAVDDQSLTVNAAALEALATLTGQRLGLDPGAWLAWLAETDRPFAAQGVYLTRGFRRPRHPVEWLPFVPAPPTESPAPPVGMVREPDLDGGSGS